ncbi:MAG: heme-binding protein [Alphaproteobacteria bacterium]
MPTLTLDHCRTIVEKALEFAHARDFKPLGIVVLDARAAVRMTIVEDNNALLRADIAHGKAFGAIALGVGSRTINKMALERPHFVSAAGGLTRDRMVPVPGGVLIKDPAGVILGAVGVSGDTSDNDEAAAIAGIEAAGLAADPGAA